MNQRLPILAKWTLQNAFLPRCPAQIRGLTAQGHTLRSATMVGFVIYNVRPTNKFYYSNT